MGDVDKDFSVTKVGFSTSCPSRRSVVVVAVAMGRCPSRFSALAVVRIRMVVISVGLLVIIN